jgi:hypothetical protein
MSLLSIVTDAAVECHVDIAAAVYASTDDQDKLFVRCAQQEGKSLAGRHNWQALVTEKTFTTTAAAAQTSSIPTDFDRMVPESMFNRTHNRQVTGPLDPVEWQFIQSSLVAMVNPAFRIRGDTILLTPTPPAGETVAYEYISTKWCQSSGNAAQVAWLADTDTAKLNEEAMTLGVIWRFKKSKGMPWNDDYLVYERYVGDLIMRDGSRPRIYTDRNPNERRPIPPQVPDTLVFT